MTLGYDEHRELDRLCWVDQLEPLRSALGEGILGGLEWSLSGFLSSVATDRQALGHLPQGPSVFFNFKRANAVICVW